MPTNRFHNNRHCMLNATGFTPAIMVTMTAFTVIHDVTYDWSLPPEDTIIAVIIWHNITTITYRRMRTHHRSTPNFLDADSLFNLIIQIQFFADFKCHQRPRRCSVPTPATSRLPSSENCRLLTKPTYTGKTVKYSTISALTLLVGRQKGHLACKK